MGVEDPVVLCEHFLERLPCGRRVAPHLSLRPHHGPVDADPILGVGAGAVLLLVEAHPALAGGVAQGLELSQGLGIEIRSRSTRVLVDLNGRSQPDKPVLEIGQQNRFFGGEIPPLSWVGHQIINLGPRRADELEMVGSHRPQRRPAIVQERIERLGVDLAVDRGSLAPDKGHEALPVNRLRRIDPDGIENRGVEIHVADRGRHDPAAGNAAGRSDDQRDVDRRVVDEEPVRQLPVIAEPLAVIPGDDDERIVEQTAILEKPPETAEERIGVGHFAVIRPPLVLRQIGFGRGVGIVRVVEVEPDKEGSVVVALLEPGLCRCDRLRSRSLNRAEIRRLVEGAEIEVIEIVVKALRDPPPRVEDKGADETGGRPASRRQGFGQRRQFLPHPVADVFPDAVCRRVETGQNGCVGGQGEGHRARGIGKADAFGGETVERRCSDILDP